MSTASTALRADARVIGLVGLAHGVSHLYQLVIPSLFPWIKASFGLSYAQLGLITTVFYAVSGVFQAMAGFAVDRFGAQRMLLAGLVLLAAGAAVTGLDFSKGMLAVAAARHPEVDFVQGDLREWWPFDDGRLDAVLCALVGEHLDDLDAGTVECPHGVADLLLGELVGLRVAAVAQRGVEDENPVVGGWTHRPLALA